MRFVDEVRLTVASGRGGDGCVSFRRARFHPRGGPDGGDGGRGGSVILVATRQRNTLVDLRWNKVYRAPNGKNGKGGLKTGSAGADLVIEVPVGTVVLDEETGEPLADLRLEGYRWTIGGGHGGQGNIHYATATRRTPDYASPGGEGTEHTVRLELRLLADIGLVGFPNAGKSTLLGRISAARPRVADYPFTTLVPVLGVVVVGDDTAFVVADLPGLIEGAAEGAGLGHRFLKHVARCAALVHLVAADAEEGVAARWGAIRREIEAWEGDLASRPEIVVLSRADLLDDAARRQAVDALHAAAGQPPIALSCATGLGLDALRAAMASHVAARTLAEAPLEAP